MSDFKTPPTQNLYARIALACGVAVALGGAVALAGWIFDEPLLRGGFFRGITVKANAAICLILSGVALSWRAARTRPARTLDGRSLASVLGIVVSSVGILTLSQHLFGWNLGIDELFFSEPPEQPATASPNRMGPPAATCFTLLGLAIWLNESNQPRYRLAADYLAIAIGLMAFLPILGYAYGVSAFFGISRLTGISFPTAVLFLLSSVALTCLDVEGPLPSLLNAPTVGGVVVRLLLLPAILVPAALGLVVMAGQRANFYEASFGTALLAIALIVVFATIVWSSGHVLHSLDVARSRAEENERQTTERLRAANDERGRLLENERHARAAAERASLMKDEFLSTLSHELRTPLNAILGYATLLQSAQLEPSEMAEAVDTIERNARLQAKLIEDLLDMNRIISGKIRLEVQQLDFEQLIDASIETVLLSASSKHIMLQRHVDVPRGIVVGDPARVQQILWNLLSNAVKFTQDGGLIEVSAQQVDSSVEIRVADNGMGIAQEFLPYVFDRFRQADATTTRRHGGLGLGLAIVKHLAELHGGSVDVQSQGPGHGSCFIVRLPATTPQPTDQEAATIGTSSAPNPAADVPLTGLRVLAVDDETDSAILVQRVLQHAGAAVDVVHSPQDARERLARNEYDILISDIGMPGEDGYEFLRRLRAEASQHQTIPALAVTAFARPEDEARARQAGFDGHLPKPIDRQSLVERVARLANVSEV